MKKISLSIILVCSLLGAPVPAQAQAASGMADMMRIMMEMFFWMMSGGSGMGNSMPGNPLLGGGGWGNSPWRWGNTLPYSNTGMYSPSLYGYPGVSSPYATPFSSPYSNPYSSLYNTPYNLPYSAGNYYGNNRPYNGRRYNAYGVPVQPPYRGPYQTPPVIVQPVIIKQPLDAETKKSAEWQNKTQTTKFAKPSRSKVIPPPEYPRDEVWQNDNPLIGKWQGINGEYLELGEEGFYLRTRDAELRGTYQFKNGIMKVLLENKPNPFYLQVRFEKDQLIFHSEDGQMMLFHQPRVPGYRARTAAPSTSYPRLW